MSIVVAVVLILLAILVGIAFWGVMLAQKTFFCAFPRTSAYGDPNKLRYIHLNGFLFIISNDLWCKDVVFQSEASNMMFQYNLKSTMDPKEILNSKKNLNIEMLDVTTNTQLSYSVPHSAKAQAIRFFNRYRELMQRINQHKMQQQSNSK